MAVDGTGKQLKVGDDIWLLTGHMLASAVLLRRSCTSRVGARLRTSSEIFLVFRLLCPPHLGQTITFVPFRTGHARMPFHFVYETGPVTTSIAGHYWLGFPLQVDLARLTARSNTGLETGDFGHGFTV